MRHLALLVVATVVAVAIGAAQAGKATSSPPTFWVLHQKDKPIEQLIEPGHETVEVRKDQSAPTLIGPPPNSGVLEWWAKRLPIAAIVSVRSVTPKLTPERDWVQSTVRATVDKVLKYSPDIFVQQEVRFLQDGGHIVIGRTKVKAVLQFADLFEPGQRYLIFADPHQTDGTLLVDPLLSFGIEGADEHLAPLAHAGPMASERGTPLAKALSRIDASLKKTP